MMAGFQPPSARVLYRRILRSLRGFDDKGQRWYYKNWSRGACLLLQCSGSRPLLDPRARVCGSGSLLVET